MQTIRRVHQCLNPRLTEIIQQVATIEKLNQQLKPFLPQSLSEHFAVASFKNGYLILTTQDPVWASQLRYHLPELRDTLRSKAGLYQLTTIKISIDLNPRPTQTKPHTLPLSAKAKAAVLSGSELCNYIPLKEALKEFVRHSQRKESLG